MPDYSYQELIAMQNDAVKRVEEMRSREERAAKRAREELESEKASESKNTPPKPGDKARRAPMPDDYIRDLKSYAEKAATSSRSGEKSAVPHIPKPPAKQGVPFSFGDISLDSDMVLLLSIILLLAEENPDEGLLTALLYMMT